MPVSTWLTACLWYWKIEPCRCVTTCTVLCGCVCGYVCDAGWAMECGRVGLIVSASPPASHGYRRPHRRYVT